MSASTQRIASIDALRGFDMLWIIGAEKIIVTAAALTNLPILNWAAFHMDHAAWEGFRFYDNIFPLFLFLAGVSLPFSILRRKQKGESLTSIYKHIIMRMIVLVVLGCLVNGMLANPWNGFGAVRYASVLGRIGIAWGVAAMLLLHFDYKKLIAIAVSILIAYWAMLKFIPVPNVGAGVFTLDGNLASYLDQRFLPGVLYRNVMDPEGLLSTLPAVSTALIGAITGFFIQSTHARLNPVKKAMYMAISGAVFIALGYAWNIDLPIIKSIWSSSFVLVAAGLALILLSVFYFLIDVKGYHRFAFPFKVVGMNSIFIYLCTEGALQLHATSKFFFSAPISLLPEVAQPFAASIFVLSIEWYLLYFLYKKGIFFKI